MIPELLYNRLLTLGKEPLLNLMLAALSEMEAYNGQSSTQAIMKTINAKETGSGWILPGRATLRRDWNNSRQVVDDMENDTKLVMPKRKYRYEDWDNAEEDNCKSCGVIRWVIDGLCEECHEDVFQAEVERAYLKRIAALENVVVQRGARLRVVWDWMYRRMYNSQTKVTGLSLFLKAHPEAKNWFDEERNLK